MRRAAKVLGFGLGGLVVLLGVAYVFRLSLFGGLIAAKLEGALAEAFGGRFRVEGIEGSLLADVRVLGLETVEAPTEGTVRHLAFDAAGVEYDLLGLLFSDAPLGALRRVVVEGLDVRLDLTASEGGDGTLPDLTSPPLDHPLPDVDVRGRLQVELGGQPFRTGDLRIERRGPDAITLRIADVHVGDADVEGSLEGTLAREGTTTLRWTSATRLGQIGLPAATWETNGRLQARLATGGGDLDVTLAPGRAGVATGKLDLARLPAWLGRVVPPSAPLPTRGTLTGRAELTHLEPLGLEADVEVVDLAWRTWDARRVRLLARTDAAGVVLIDRASAEIGDARFDLREGVFDPEAPYLLRRLRSVEARVPDLAALVPGYVRRTAVTIRARQVDGARLEVLELEAKDEAGTLRATGEVELPARPEAIETTRVALDVVGRVDDLASFGLDGLTGGVEFEGRVEGVPDRLVLRLRKAGGDAAYQDHALEALVAEATLEDFETLRLTGATLASGDLQGEGTGLVTWVGEETRLDVEAKLEVGDLAAWIPGDVARGGARIDARVEGPASALQVRAEVEAGGVEVAGLRLLEARAQLAWIGEEVEIQTLRVRTKEGRLEAKGAYDTPAQRLRLEAVDVEVEDGPRVGLCRPLEAVFGEDGLAIARLCVQVDDATLDAADVAVDFDASTARVRSLVAEQGGRTARLDAPLTLGWEGERIEVSSLDVETGGWRLTAEASVAPSARRADLHALRVAGHDVEATLAGPAVVQWDDEGVQARELVIDAFGGRITGQAAWRGALSARLAATGLDLSRYVPDVQGRVDLELTLDGEVGEVAVQVPALQWGDVALAAEALVRQGAEGGLRVASLRVQGKNGLDLEGTASLPWRVGQDGLTRLDASVAALELGGALPSLGAVTDLRSGPLRIRITGDDAGLEGRLSIPDLLPGSDAGARDDGDVTFTLTPTEGRATVRLQDAGIAEVVGTVRLDGGFDWTDPRDAKRLLDASIDGEIRADVRDWEALAPLLAGVRRIEGELGARVTLKGTPREPRLAGDVTIRNGMLEISSAIPVVSSLDARVVWRGDRVTIEELRGELGYAPFEIGGHVDRPLDASPTFELSFQGKNVLAARSDAMRLRTDADLTVRGPLDELVTSGRLRITSLLYVKPVSMSGGGPAIPAMGFRLFSIEEGPLSTMRFDVRIEADETIRIRNNIARGRLSADLVLGGTGKRPEPAGRVVAKQASIFLPVTTLHLQGAEVVFPPDDPFGPRVQATARSRASGYELGVRATGRLPDLDVVVYSRPRLSDEDAMLLLATGATAGAAGSSGVQSVTFQKALEFFGKNLFSYARATADPDERPFFERFALTIGREQSRRGNETVETELGITDRVYLTFDRDRYDETNFGFVWRFRLP